VDFIAHYFAELRGSHDDSMEFNFLPAKSFYLSPRSEKKSPHVHTMCNERLKESQETKPAISLRINDREMLPRVIFLLRCSDFNGESSPPRGGARTKINLFVSAMGRCFAEIAFSPWNTRNGDDFQFVFPPFALQTRRRGSTRA